MLKARNKKFSLIMAIVFALTMIFPFSAFASTTEVLSIPNVNDDSATNLGTVFFNFTAGQLQNGDSVTISLPEDFQFLKAGGSQDQVMTDSEWDSVGSGVYGQTNGNYFKIPAKYLDNDNALNGVALDITMLDDNEIQVTVNGNLDESQNAYLYLYLGNVYVKDGFDGDINLSVKAPSTSGFQSGKITVGRVSGGTLDLEVTDAPTFSDSDTTTIRVEEDVPGTLDNTDESLKFTLPDGFEWGTVDSVKVYWGEDKKYGSGTTLAANLKSFLKTDKDELTLALPSDFESTKAIAFEIKANITVEDETEAKVGDIVAKVSGDSDYNQTELVVGQYGQFETSITAGDPTTIVAGMLEQKIADITIQESIKESLIKGRTLTLTLPSNFKWNKIDTDTDSGTGLDFVGFPGKDGKTAKWVVKDNSTDAAKLVLSEMEVAVEPGTTGDLVIEVGGTAGLSGELTVAKVQQPVTITAADKPVLAIGKADQPIGDITITENVAGALSDNDDLYLVLPDGFKWSKYSDIQVTAGDLKIDNGGITTANSDTTLVIPIDNDSNTASTISIKNAAVTVDRTAPEGDMYVKVKGNAVNEVNNKTEVQDSYGTTVNGYLQVDGQPCFDVNTDYALFPETGTAAKTYAATVGTPAPSESKLSTTVTLGDNGSYISGGRIMVQLRDAANALGVEPQNIFWDNATKTATFIKGDRVAQITVGVNQVKLNGVALPTDKGAELKDGRTFVSLSQAGTALGATATWDNATKTATLTVK